MRQDEELDEFSASVQRIGGVGLTINEELIGQEFCLEHRTYKSHVCPNVEPKSRIVVICEACATAIEKEEETDTSVLERHKKSNGCDPSKKAKCPVKHCKELLTFSNTSKCKMCNMKVRLKHKFATDHECMGKNIVVRNGMNCIRERPRMPSRILIRGY